MNLRTTLSGRGALGVVAATAAVLLLPVATANAAAYTVDLDTAALDVVVLSQETPVGLAPGGSVRLPDPPFGSWADTAQVDVIVGDSVDITDVAVAADAQTPGSVLITLPVGLGAGDYSVFLTNREFTAGDPEDTAVGFFFPLEVGADAPAVADVDWQGADAEFRGYLLDVTGPVRSGDTLTLRAPAGVSLTDALTVLSVSEPGDPDITPVYPSDEAGIVVAVDGASTTLTIPAYRPTRDGYADVIGDDDGYEPVPVPRPGEPLGNGATFTLGVFVPEAPGLLELPAAFSYFISGLVLEVPVVTPPVATPSTPVRVPTAVPAGGGLPEQQVPAPAPAPALATAGLLLAAGAALTLRRRQAVHRRH